MIKWSLTSKGSSQEVDEIKIPNFGTLKWYEVTKDAKHLILTNSLNKGVVVDL